MKINNPKTGEIYNNPYCDGRCYCHHMGMIHGNDPNICAECGCPKTQAGFRRLKDEENQPEPTVNNETI